jgi:methylglyoxal synthase
LGDVLVKRVLIKNRFMDKVRYLPVKKRIALVAHDHKKADLMEWVVYNKKVLIQHDLVATGTTGRLLQEQLDHPVKRFLSGPLGGDQQVGALIAEGRLDIIIFFWDPMEQQPHDSDVKALLRLAVTWNIIIACNRTTADFVLTSFLMNDDYPLVLPDYSSYLNRKITIA